MLKELCLLNGASGDETAVRDYIISQIKDFCEYKTDALGSIIAYKKGKKTPKNRVMLSAHMDEVGFIVTSVTDEGFLKFAPVGGINPENALTRRVSINGNIGVIGAKPVHLMKSGEKDEPPAFSDMLIDIGVSCRSDALKYACEGDYAYFSSDYAELGGGYIKSKALDDRIGCMLLIELIRSDLEYDTCFCFNSQEEVGLRGAQCTAFDVKPDIAVVLEATTAADIEGVDGSERCCILGNGPVVSYMDSRTVYDRGLYSLAIDVAKDNGIPVQTKTVIAGGNDAGAIQTSAGGCRTAAVSVPCRYIHSGSCVVKKSDIESTRAFLAPFLNRLYDL